MFYKEGFITDRQSYILLTLFVIEMREICVHLYKRWLIC